MIKQNIKFETKQSLWGWNTDFELNLVIYAAILDELQPCVICKLDG